MSLYQQLGGSAAVDALAVDFLARVVADDSLAPWYADADHGRIAQHLTAYLAVAFGGPEGYGGRSIRNAHATLRITDEAFDAVLGHFADSLVAIAAAPQHVKRATRMIAALRPIVVLPAPAIRGGSPAA